MGRPSKLTAATTAAICDVIAAGDTLNGWLRRAAQEDTETTRLLERRHPADWSRRTELVLPDEQAAEDPLIGVHDELRLARLDRQKQLAAGSEEGR